MPRFFSLATWSTTLAGSDFDSSSNERCDTGDRSTSAGALCARDCPDDGEASADGGVCCDRIPNAPTGEESSATGSFSVSSSLPFPLGDCNSCAPTHSLCGRQSNGRRGRTRLYRLDRILAHRRRQGALKLTMPRSGIAVTGKVARHRSGAAPAPRRPAAIPSLTAYRLSYALCRQRRAAAPVAGGGGPPTRSSDIYSRLAV